MTITQANADNKRPAKRFKFSRSTNGCLACRQQKVKCDETRPMCLRCVAGQKDCEYPQKARKTSAPTSETCSKNGEDTEVPSGESVKTVSVPEPTSAPHDISQAQAPNNSGGTQSLDAAVLDFSSLLMSPTDAFATLTNDAAGSGNVNGMALGDWCVQDVAPLSADLAIGSMYSQASTFVSSVILI
jgi:hypothetical protein